MTKSTAKSATVLATITKADGTTMEIVAGGEAAPLANATVKPLAKHRVNRGAVLKGLPTEERLFLADVPVFEDGKFVGIKEEEQKAATVVGRISVKNLDLRKFAKQQ